PGASGPGGRRRAGIRVVTELAVDRPRCRGGAPARGDRPRSRDRGARAAPFLGAAADGPRPFARGGIVRTGLRRSAAIALALGLVAASMTTAAADEIELDVEIPALTDEPFEVTDAQLSWGLNEETGSGAFAGGCN